jgi:hypothetical protein
MNVKPRIVPRVPAMLAAGMACLSAGLAVESLRIPASRTTAGRLLGAALPARNGGLGEEVEEA